MMTFLKERRWTAMRRVQVLLVGAAAGLLAGCSVFGGDEKPKAAAAPPVVGKLTTDCARLQMLFGPDDQEITRDQMEAGLKTVMTKWDADGSGDLTHSEVQPLNDYLRQEYKGASPVTDWNADGRVDFKELGAGWRTMFDLCDRNRNKSVSLRELGFSPNVAPPRTAPQPEKKKPEGASERPPGAGL